MEFVRGDTFSFKFLINRKDGTAVKKDDIDTLFVTVKKTIYSQNTIFQKTLNDVEIDSKGYCHVIFKPEDTETLEYGKCVFDVEITLKNGYRKTKLFEFNLEGETTFHGGEIL